MHVVIQIQPFRRKPKKLKSLFSRNKQRSKDIKHFTTASEIKSYQGHLPKLKPQEMITQYACNKPASWPLNIRFSAAKTRFTQWKFRMSTLISYSHSPAVFSRVSCNCNSCSRHTKAGIISGFLRLRRLRLMTAAFSDCMSRSSLFNSKIINWSAPLVSFILFWVSPSFTTSSSKSWCWSVLEFRFFTDAFFLFNYMHKILLSILCI